MAGVDIDVEVSHRLDELVQAGVRAITQAVAAAAGEMRSTHIPAEAPSGPSGALRTDWHVRERDPLTHVVHPGDDAFYAHIVARGRRPFRTRKPYQVRPETWRMAAGSTRPNRFDERAIAALEARTDELMDAALADQGI